MSSLRTTSHEVVIAIRQRRRDNEPLIDIARDYGISPSAVSRIARGNRRAGVKEDEQS